jgi:hypothetical protein
MHAAIPFATQNGALLHARFQRALLGRPTAGRANGVCTLKQVLAFIIEIAQGVRLQSICKDTEQKVAGEVSGRVSPEDCSPTRSKLFSAEIAQARDLDI